LNRGTVPIIARLRALQTAARPAPGGARTIAVLSDPDPLAALLREINETILGRTLTFESSGGTRLSLEVSGRRVLRLTTVHGLTGAEGCLAAPTLEDAHKDDLIQLLQGVAAPRHELRVTSTSMEWERAEVSVGLPVALLADLLLIDLNALAGDAASGPGSTPAAAPDPGPPAVPADAAAADGFLGRFAAAIGPGLMAWRIAGGSDDGISAGPGEMVAHLGLFLGDEADALQAQLNRVAHSPPAPVCLVLGASLLDGHGILCARSGDGLLLGLVDGAGAKALPAAWSAALA